MCLIANLIHFIGLGGIAINYILSGKYFALSGGTIREAENYDILRKYTPFPLISESVNYFKEYEPINLMGVPIQLLSYSLIINLVFAIIVIALGYYFYNTNFRESWVRKYHARVNWYKKKDMAVKKYCMESASNLKMVFMDWLDQMDLVNLLLWI